MNNGAMANKVLFLCTGNSCRSQMAEGWLRHCAAGRAEVFSAGTKPLGLNRMAVAVMRQAGIDISGHRSKHVDELAKEDFLFVITVLRRRARSVSCVSGSALSVALES